MHTEITARAYSDPHLDLANAGDVVALLTIVQGEKAWDQRHHHVRHFVMAQEKMGRSVYVIHHTAAPANSG